MILQFLQRWLVQYLTNGHNISLATTLPSTPFPIHKTVPPLDTM